MKLVAPTTVYKQSYIQAVEESKNENGITVIAKPQENQSFEEFVKNKIGQAIGLNLPQGYVTSTELWLIDKDQFIGTANIRHSLTPHLHKVGGHIGYWIRPTKRKMGYGQNILKLALAEAKKLGINPVLVTCDDTNTGSRRIIEANGGVLENIVDNGQDNPRKRRYWINVGSKR